MVERKRQWPCWVAINYDGDPVWKSVKPTRPACEDSVNAHWGIKRAVLTLSPPSRPKRKARSKKP